METTNSRFLLFPALEGGREEAVEVDQEDTFLSNLDSWSTFHRHSTPGLIAVSVRETRRRSPMITASRLTTSREVGSSGQRTEGSSGWILVSRESEDRNIESWILMISPPSLPSSLCLEAEGGRGDHHQGPVSREE